MNATSLALLASLAEKTKKAFIALYNTIFNTIDLLTAWIVGTFWLVYTLITGLSIGPDSGYFLNCALRFHSGGDFFVDPTQAPLYPFLVNICMYFTQSPGSAAALLSGIIMLLLLTVFALLLREFNQDVRLNALLLLCLFTFSKFIYIFTYAWSDGLFSLLVLSTLYFLVKHHKQPHQKYLQLKYYIPAALSVAMASLTQYMGYSLIICFILYSIYFLWQHHRKSPLKKTANNGSVLVIKYLIWSSLAFLPLGLYITRNYIISETLHGSFQPAELTVFENLHRLLTVLQTDLSIYFIVLLVLAIAFFLLFIKSIHSNDGIPLVILLGLIFAYLVQLLYTTTTECAPDISTRNMSPLYPLFFLFVFLSIRLMADRELGPDTKNADSFRFPGKLSIFLLYLSAITLLLVQGKDFTRTLDLPYDIKNSPNCSAVSCGYDFSNVPADIGSYLHQQFKETDTLYLSSLYESPNRIHDPYLANAFLLKPIIYKYQSRSFSDVFPETLNQMSRGFSIRFKPNSENKNDKRLIYLNLPSQRAGRALLSRLPETMKNAGTDSLILVVNCDHVNIRIGDHLGKFLPRALKINEKRKIGGYVFYRLILEK